VAAAAVVSGLDAVNVSGNEDGFLFIVEVGKVDEPAARHRPSLDQSPAAAAAEALLMQGLGRFSCA